MDAKRIFCFLNRHNFQPLKEYSLIPNDQAHVHIFFKCTRCNKEVSGIMPEEWVYGLKKRNEVKTESF